MALTAASSRGEGENRIRKFTSIVLDIERLRGMHSLDLTSHPRHEYS
jgi:hypothetical protein